MLKRLYTSSMIVLTLVVTSNNFMFQVHIDKATLTKGLIIFFGVKAILKYCWLTF